ncbi:SRPBCC family protein [Pseudonocardia nematodicida]|uniref:SRPBCC family protein n=1 Tax=Pseudonocardia nematodicida TaxID=1206997 RepID=A0ABV1KA03_9PSEU
MDIRREIDATERVVGGPTAGTTDLHGVTDLHSVTVARTYPTDVDDLWEACTTADRLARWLLPVEGDLREGGRYQLEGQAGGTILACRAPYAFDATWEYGGETSWIEVRLHPEADDRSRLELTHRYRIADDHHWLRYGPAATGVGWDLAMVGLAHHLGDGGTPHGESDDWASSAEGRAFLAAAGEAWLAPIVAGGLDPDDARARTDRTVAFFTGAAH